MRVVETPPPAPISQPAPVSEHDRVVSLDVVRGLAVLGILVMNIVEFALPMSAYASPIGGGGSDGANRWTWLIQASLFDGRMRALFSMLFGAGIVMIHQRMQAKGRGGAADLLLRRCLWLIPFGIAHRFLLQWTGDILYIYGLLGALAIAFRTLRPRSQILIGLSMLLMFLPMELRSYSKGAEQRAMAEQAVALEAEGEEIPEDLESARSRWERRTAAPSADANDDEIHSMHGSWLDIAELRWDHNHRFQHAFIYYYFVWDVLGMVLLGMGLGGLGFFAGRMRTQVYVAALLTGLAATATSCLLAQSWAAQEWSRGALENRFWHGTLYPFLRGLGGLGWAAGLLLVLRANVLGVVTRCLGAVGRMAFSNYVLQTLLGTLLFFGWGFGLYGDLARAELMAVVAAFSAVQITFSMLWLKRFRFGPLEWCWRSLTYWQRQPMRRT